MHGQTDKNIELMIKISFRCQWKGYLLTVMIIFNLFIVGWTHHIFVIWVDNLWKGGVNICISNEGINVTANNTF